MPAGRRTAVADRHFGSRLPADVRCPFRFRRAASPRTAGPRCIAHIHRLHSTVVRQPMTQDGGLIHMKRMLFVALLVTASAASGRAQQGQPPPVSLSQLQREAAAVQGATAVPTPPPITPITAATPTVPAASTQGATATMTPVTI